jgi:hypothetical protein
MKRILLLFSVLLATGIMAACGGAAETVVPAEPVPTTEPLQAVEDAIMAANDGDYERANQLLDISALAEAADAESVTDTWDQVTSNRRVATVKVTEEELSGEARRLFVVVENDNYPTYQVGFWVQWQDDRWVASAEQ